MDFEFSEDQELLRATVRRFLTERAPIAYVRDMLDDEEPYPLAAWSAQFQRIREDLADALRREEQVAVARRTPEQRQYLGNSLAQFWDAVDRTLRSRETARRMMHAHKFGYRCRRGRRHSARQLLDC